MTDSSNQTREAAANGAKRDSAKPAAPLHPPLEVTDDAHRFGDARDAIDAVSRFEADTAEFWEYAIEARGLDAWVVKVNRIDGKPLRGFLSPIA